MRSAADIEEVGWPEPAAVLQRMESTRSCWPSWRANSRSVVAIVSVTAMSLLGTNGAKVPLAGGLRGSIRKVYRAQRRWPDNPPDSPDYPRSAAGFTSLRPDYPEPWWVSDRRSTSVTIPSRILSPASQKLGSVMSMPMRFTSSSGLVDPPAARKSR